MANAKNSQETPQLLSQFPQKNFAHILAENEAMTEADLLTIADLGVTLPLNTLALRDYLPHRYPFMLVDRVIACRPSQDIIGIKNVTINEPFFTGHFPDAPIMPGVLMIEAMAQVAGVLGFISDHKKPADGYLYLFAGVEKVRFKRQVIPGDQLILRAKTLMVKQGISKFDCTAHVDNQLVATAQLILSCQFTPPGIQ